MASDKTVISAVSPAEAELLDARHLACPLPLFLLRRELLCRPSGAQVWLWATAPATRRDLPDFCADNGFRLLTVQETGEGLKFLVERS
ncbi:sulfurtransferase TusA family protein [Novispirillum itersonii]|uniref:tRNA 2-thiouridine synthesizing protein A n=1 Tax=Novispirillum itersonii TaxID=189 RepID=A0A7X0DMA3_NOVIT|nr:sulfurtransferase TusA family protein [Novispirillum itersonii]MBB6208982.1 tRNA 2-thiouridine synthesizing protein A [Novispirillum itersonii]